MHAAPPAPACPRCAYDQSGQVSRWEAEPAWPLGGRCSECGLDFEWADLLAPARNNLPWLFEHTPRWRVGFIRAWRTWFRALNPRRLWRDLRLEARVSIPRLFLWPIVLCLLFHVVAASAQLWLLYQAWKQFKSLPAGTFGSNPFWDREFLNALLDPFVQFADWSPNRKWTPSSPLLEQMPYAVAGPLAAVPLTPVVLFLLMPTRSVSRVRPAHLLRVGVYQLAVFLPLYALYAAQAVWEARALWQGRWGGGPIQQYFVPSLPSIGAALLLWYAWYWYEAIVHGLRMRHGRRIWALLMIAAGLLALNVAISDVKFLRLMRWID